MYHTEHFNPDVDKMLKCPHCGLYSYDEEFLDTSEDWRVLCGFPWPVISGCRCPHHQGTVGSKGSMGEHIVIVKDDIVIKQCTAMDILVRSRYRLWKMLDIYYTTPRLKNYFRDIAFITNITIHIARGRKMRGIGRY